MTTIFGLARFCGPDDFWVRAATETSQQITDRDSEGSTVLHHAIDACNFELAKSLVESGHIPLSVPNRYGRTELYYAYKCGNDMMIMLLRNHGVGLSCLMQVAIQDRDRDVCERLLEDGADINGSDLDGLTPLAYACIDQNIDAIAWLIDHGAIPDLLVSGKKDYEDRYGRSLLHYAICCIPDPFEPGSSCSSTRLCNSVKFIKKLIECETKCCAKDSRGFEPIHYAVQKGVIAVCNMLIEKGASLKTKSYNGVGVLDICHPSMVDYIKSHVSIEESTDDPENTFTEKGFKKMMRRFNPIPKSAS